MRYQQRQLLRAIAGLLLVGTAALAALATEQFLAGETGLAGIDTVIAVFAALLAWRSRSLLRPARLASPVTVSPTGTAVVREIPRLGRGDVVVWTVFVGLMGAAGGAVIGGIAGAGVGAVGGLLLGAFGALVRVRL